MSIHPNSRSNRTVQVERKNDTARRSFKPKPWNHQDELKALRGKNVMMRVRLGSDDEMVVAGQLVESDAFTVKIFIDYGHGRKSTVIYFKSAIVSFQEHNAMGVA